MTPDTLVEFVALSKTYRGATAPALDELSLVIPQGSFFGLLGPNGAGKTTLIAILCGLIAPDEGIVRIDAPDGVRSMIGLVPQHLAFYPTLTVEENLAFFAAMHGLRGTHKRERVADCLAIGKLEGLATKRAGTLSGGLKRRLNLAIGLLNAPRLLVLDEPTVGVDAQSRRHVQDELRRLNAGGTTVLYTSHYLDEVQSLCDRLAIIDHGRIVAHGLTGDLLEQNLVSIRLAQPPGEAVLAALRELRAVTSLRHDGSLVALIADRREQTLADALHVLRRLDVPVLEASFGARNLESLFFQLTGARLRDGGGIGDDADAPR